MEREKDVSPERSIADLEPLSPKKRSVGRPRKIEIPPPEASSEMPPPYDAGFWYCYPAPDDDDVQFERLLGEECKLLEDCPEIEWLVYLDCHVRELVRIYHREFTVDGLSDFSKAYRSPFTHDGNLTASGIAKARVLVCRERILAGTVTPAERKPDLSKLRNYLGPLAWELMVERSYLQF